MSQLAFTAFSLNGVDAQKFLQGQVTVHVERLLKMKIAIPLFVT
jgi:folate-binding Fe-S cluster repair protein YgfZ